ncbi:MAG: PH domain-containing protein [Candidatus Saganbacteria bacterium]|nr:PH domain-containing protein [Candidatus Saganbacteria bacterium]
MFCKKCGKEIKDGVDFCNHCGAPLKGQAAPAAAAAPRPVVETGNPVMEFKPKFIPKLFLFQGWPYLLAIVGMTFWSILSVLLGSFDFETVIELVIVLCVATGYFVLKKNSYAKTDYRFYNTRLDYYEGFLTIDEKTIKYDKITEINLRKGFFQRMFGLGSIILSTPATGGGHGGNPMAGMLGGFFGGGRMAGRGAGMAASGIQVWDIEKPDEKYKKIKELISKANKV